MLQLLSSEAAAHAFWCARVASLMFVGQNPGRPAAMHRMSLKALAALCLNFRIVGSAILLGRAFN